MSIFSYLGHILDYLAIAQHHSLPTRLLDWTLNPVYALWFALPSKEYYSLQSRFMDKSKCIPIVTAIEIKDSDYFDPNKLPSNLIEIEKEFKFYNPRPLSKRIYVQQGIFSVHRFDQTRKVYIPLEDEIEFLKDRKCVRFIPNNPSGFDGAENLFTILQQLSNLGANYQTIYPDLDGFCNNFGVVIIKKMFEKYIEEIKIESDNSFKV